MATRKIKDAKDLDSNELIYFKGHAKATYLSNGATVEDSIGEVKSDLSTAINSLEEILENSTPLKKITYSDLVNLVNTNSLVPGKYYRITDYNTEVGNSSIPTTTIISANHPFDIIVVAITESKLSENAKVCLRDGDSYFSSNNLNAWEIKYCLTNDTKRFPWAAASGKGIIYYLKDEFNNEATYDFKNIMTTPYHLSKKDKYYYTFSNKENDVITDLSLKSECKNNIIKNTNGPTDITLIKDKTLYQSAVCDNNAFDKCMCILCKSGAKSVNINADCKHIVADFLGYTIFDTQSNNIFGKIIEDSYFGKFTGGFKFLDNSGNYNNAQGITIEENNNPTEGIFTKIVGENLVNIDIKSGVSGVNQTITVGETGNYVTVIEKNKEGEIAVYNESVNDINRKLETHLENFGNKISGTINIKNGEDLETVWNLLTNNGDYATYIITDETGNYPSPNVHTVYIDNEDLWLDLFYRANGAALKNLVKSPEAYFKVTNSWSSQSIGSYVSLPKYHLCTAKVGDLVTFIRQEIPAKDFYSKYIDYNQINFRESLDLITREIFNGWIKGLGIDSNLSDGEIVEQLILMGLIYSCQTDPNNTEETPTPLSVDETVVWYTAKITPNTQNVFSGEFWTGNMTGPGIYSYVNNVEPNPGTDSGEVFTGYVAPNGAQTLISVQNPAKVFTRPNRWAGWTKLGLVKNTEMFPSRGYWMFNSDEALETGVYPLCRTKNDDGTTVIPGLGECSYFTCIIHRTTTNDGAYDTIEQTAYGRELDSGKIYKRIIFYKSDGTDTQYGDWIRIDENANEEYATKEYVDGLIEDINSVLESIING